MASTANSDRLTVTITDQDGRVLDTLSIPRVIRRGEIRLAWIRQFMERVLDEKYSLIPCDRCGVFTPDAELIEITEDANHEPRIIAEAICRKCHEAAE